MIYVICTKIPITHKMLHIVVEPFNKDFNKDSNVDIGIVIVIRQHLCQNGPHKAKKIRKF